MPNGNSTIVKIFPHSHRDVFDIQFSGGCRVDKRWIARFEIHKKQYDY